MDYYTLKRSLRICFLFFVLDNRFIEEGSPFITSRYYKMQRNINEK